jgi:NAD(P)-dependent dehydrogenase (short-subunit alcohol dehydrogenase family)
VGLAREGYDIAGNARSYNAGRPDLGLAGTEALCREAGADFLPIPGDVADLECHEGLVSAALDQFGVIHLLVNNAGVAPLSRMDFLETTPESYDRVLGTNLRGPFFLTQRIAGQMVKAQGERAIIFITSISADTSSPDRAEYCLSKAGLSHLARICAHRLASEGINVYEVRPGVIRTDMTAPVEEKYDALIAQGLIPQRRWGEAEDVARAVTALARGEFQYSTGSVFEVSGGMNIKVL